MAVLRTHTQWGILCTTLIVLFCLPLILSAAYLGIINQMGCLIIATLGMQILTGYTGQISLGHAAFFAIGAYTSAILMAEFHIPFFIAFIAAGIAAGLIGVVAGAPGLRVKGFYLVMATFAVHFIVIYTLNHWTSLTGGSEGYKFPHAQIFSLAFNNENRMFYLVMISLVLSTYAAINILRTRLGRAFVAVRDNDLASNVLGVNVWLVKLKAFFVGCFFAGLGGALWGHWAGYITPELFTLMDAIWYLGYIIIGGLGSIPGAYFGVVTVLGLKEIIARALPLLDPSLVNIVAPFTDILFGLVLILMLIFEPRGFVHRWETFKSWYRIWPFAY
ncbi:branched-chain amino acid ABC transporter permease [Thermodesulfobacteriota bacterium]